MSQKLVGHPWKYTKCRPPGRHFAWKRPSSGVQTRRSHPDKRSSLVKAADQPVGGPVASVGTLSLSIFEQSVHVSCRRSERMRCLASPSARFVPGATPKVEVVVGNG